MFRKLPAAPDYTDDQLQQLAEQMREPEAAGGWNQTGGPDPAGDNPDIPSAYTYFGQFVDHDITFDASSRLQVENDPDALVDFRTPRYDLDSLYGSGPVDEPFQYDQQRPGRLLISDNGNNEPDLPRNGQGIAIIGDPRNDEHVIVSGLQILMIRLHNKIADLVDGEGTVPEDERFDEVRRRVRWHYQWVVVNDYLPRICGPGLIGHLLRFEDGEPKYRLRFFKPSKNAYMPIEFSAAAFRFGHSQVRGAYDLNQAIGVKPIFAPGDQSGEGADLRGGQRLLANWAVDWTKFVPIAGSPAQPSRLIDSKLTAALFDLPRRPAADHQSLPLLNLLSGQRHDLPSGQDVARAVGAKALSGTDMGIQLDPTPLWFYILKESEILEGGRLLGPTGARIVAEVLLGLIKLDPASYLSQEPTWLPTLPTAAGDPKTFSLADLIEFART